MLERADDAVDGDIPIPEVRHEEGGVHHRDFRITNQVISKYGQTAGRTGCEAYLKVRGVITTERVVTKSTTECSTMYSESVSADAIGALIVLTPGRMSPIPTSSPRLRNLP